MDLVLQDIGIIEKAKIELNGLTIIAGNNDTGKSTVGKVAYSLIKAFEDFEKNYELEKSAKIERYFRDFYILLRKEVDFRKNKELMSFMDDFHFYRRVDNKKVLDLMKKIEELSKENKLGLDEKSMEELNKNFNEINTIFQEKEPRDSKIIKSIRRIFRSEFKNQMNNIFTNQSKITVLEGKNIIIDLTLKENEIIYDRAKKIDEIFPFESSLFIETPFILTYKQALQRFGNIYHVNDLLRKLATPILNNDKSKLNISHIIGGEIYFDEEEDNFAFKKKMGEQKIKIDILNSASGIKSFGILQLLENSGEFNKNSLLIIDEPEVHLHPDWQVEYAKLLISLVKNGIKVLITSHSPYLIEALNKYSKEEKMEEKVKFYLSESQENGKAWIIDKTEDKDDIFDKLSKPFERLIFGE